MAAILRFESWASRRTSSTRSSLTGDSVWTAGADVLQDDREQAVEVVGVAAAFVDRVARFLEPIRAKTSKGVAASSAASAVSTLSSCSAGLLGLD